MTLWIVLFSFLMPSSPQDAAETGLLQSEDEMRYRGIEKLLAKFEAEDGDERPLDGAVLSNG
jgi:hypothetical protein